MRGMTKAKLLALADSWAADAGMSLAMRGTSEEHKILTNPDPTARALWRCALQLADLVRETRTADEEPED